MHFGNTGEKVRQLQEKLAYLDYLDVSLVSGHFGNATLAAVRAFQEEHGEKASGMANMSMQLKLDQAYEEKISHDPAIWTVVDED